MAMYVVEYYKNENGESEIETSLNTLQRHAQEGRKEARVLINSIIYCIGRLQHEGPLTPGNIMKKLTDNIYELRPRDRRVLLFYWSGNRYILTHMFIKKTQKTPVGEIEKAVRCMTDWINRNNV